MSEPSVSPIELAVSFTASTARRATPGFSSGSATVPGAVTAAGVLTLRTGRRVLFLFAAAAPRAAPAAPAARGAATPERRVLLFLAAGRELLLFAAGRDDLPLAVDLVEAFFAVDLRALFLVDVPLEARPPFFAAGLALLFRAEPLRAVLFRALLFRAVLFRAALFRAVLFRAVLFRAVLFLPALFFAPPLAGLALRADFFAGRRAADFFDFDAPDFLFDAGRDFLVAIRGLLCQSVSESQSISVIDRVKCRVWQWRCTM
jgi:hypothetical protein